MLICDVRYRKMSRMAKRDCLETEVSTKLSRSKSSKDRALVSHMKRVHIHFCSSSIPRMFTSFMYMGESVIIRAFSTS